MWLEAVVRTCLNGDSNALGLRLLGIPSTGDNISRFSIIVESGAHLTASSMSVPLKPDSELWSCETKFDRYDSGSDMNVPPMMINSTW